MKNYVHIIEYEKRSSLWELLHPLEKFSNHSVFETKNTYSDLSQFNNVYVFHTSGRSFPMIENIEVFLKRRLNCVVFVHTAPDYIIDKGYRSFLERLLNLQNKFRLKILVPSKSVADDFLKIGILATAVRLGIPPIKLEKPERNLDFLKNRIITMNSNSAEKYLKAKGIDRFCDIIKQLKKENDAAILGIDADSDDGILRMRLTHSEFLWVLKHAKAYVQLSRSESYNITAIEARQLKVPTILSNVGGHSNIPCNKPFLCESSSDVIQKLRYLFNNNDCYQIELERCYEWSIHNECVDEFKKQIERGCSNEL